jgi:lipoyl(octanoyl) transferase
MTGIDNLVVTDRNIVRYANMGRTRYAQMWDLQKSLHALVAEDRSQDIFLINEHEHVYTLGKSGDPNHLLADADDLKRAGAEFYPIDRGGDITYHGPGQIVGYPILNLERFQKDIHWYLRQLEEVIIRTLKLFDISGKRSQGETGVWIGNEKIAALGIKVSRWVTMHGFAFNVHPDLSYFEKIIPCGIFHKGVTSMSEVLREHISLDRVVSILYKEFESVFNVDLVPIEIAEIESLVIPHSVGQTV